MEITTFELLVKRIAPLPPAAIPGADAIAAVARRVVQGYFLTISNLEDKDLTFRLEFVVSTPNPPDPDRTLTSNADLLIDIAGANTPLTLSQAGDTFRGSFRLPAKQTASVQLLPKLPLDLLSNPNPDLEIRGFVRLRLPAIFQGFPGPFIFGPQNDRPVKVLLNPETRGTFLPNDFPASTSGEFDQINYPMALASGQALNEVPPERGFRPPFSQDLVAQLAAELPERFRPRLDGLSEVQQAEALVEILSQIEPSQENLNNVSDLLSKLNIPIRMEAINR
ncbi:hypothetical protein [Pseudanabaena sp. FACHB-2040]|uniref:hypothetical protein n=1 Tax=Pseudanabaena sp. FACHB-2040 TaxID=2692859 RepID=UPI0016882935|nr:hypothetical protein [Pseudanabaena sp. FACHB-2040]MBD0268738.1 hypothetical protein [Cyanobacteria bacterium Co-bin8]MBD2260490.1 hypothetical protein [Pseudanabaena sp. FACHB-2040]